jgi:hypothetical protein
MAVSIPIYLPNRTAFSLDAGNRPLFDMFFRIRYILASLNFIEIFPTDVIQNISKF